MATNPTTIEIEIKEVPGHHGDLEWTIEPKDAAANDARFRQHEHDFKEKREKRHAKKEPDHHPIVFKEGETLEFTCPAGFRFGIGAKKDPVVDEFPGAPDNPFGWSGIQAGGENGSVSGEVIKSKNEPGPKAQAFYKFHGWVRLPDDTFVAVDPDGYCGG